MPRAEIGVTEVPCTSLTLGYFCWVRGGEPYKLPLSLGALIDAFCLEPWVSLGMLKNLLLLGSWVM